MENICTIKFPKFLLSTFLFVIFLGPLLLVILIFIIYRTLVLIILKFKFGSKFGGLLNGFDAFFATDPSSRNVINAIMILKTRHSFQELFCKLKEEINTKIFQNADQYPKFLSTRHKMCGYHYFLPNRITIDECFKILNLNWENEDISKEELLKKISSYSSETLPCNNTAFWEILLCEKPVRWNNRTIDEQDEKSFAIFFRFHHSLADGVTLLKFLVNTFSVSYEEKKVETLPEKKNFVVKIRDFVYILLMAPIAILSQKLFRRVEVSSVDVPLLSDQQILVAKVEESRECLKIIKEVKQKVKGTSFVEVLTTAISISLSNYFQTKGKDPRLTSFGSYLTVLMRKSHLQLEEEKVTKFRNAFSYTTFNIPIIYKHPDVSFFFFWRSFKETLEKVKMEIRKLSVSLEYKVTYGVFQIVPTLLPESIVLRLVSPGYLPLAITNLPGPSAITILGDCLVEDIVFWVPRIKPIGMTLGILSYDGRFQIALNVDKAIMSNEKDAQDLVDGIYQAIIQLDSKI